MHYRACGTVARVGDHFDAPVEPELTGHFVYIGCDCVGGAEASAASFKVGSLDDLADFLDGFAVQRACAADAFEPVVLGWIVAAGDHDGAVGVQILRRVVKDGRGDSADVGDVAAGGEKAFRQGVAKPRGTEAAIASEIDVDAAAMATHVSAQAAA